MKKLILILGVILSISFLLVGCGESVNDEHFVDEAVTENLTGVLNEIKYEAGVKGSHTLKIGPDNMVHLRSTSINLSDEKYLGNVVSVEGVKNATDNVFEVTSVTVIEEIEALKVKFEDYLNEDFGIKLKYYTNLKILEDGNMLSFKDEETGSDFRITQNAFNYAGDLIIHDADGKEEVVESPLQAFFIANYPEVTDYDSLLTTIGKRNLEAVELPGGIIDFETAYFVYRSGFIYEIDFYLGDDLVNEAEILVKFKTMLAEFDFTVVDNLQDSGDDDGNAMGDCLDQNGASNGNCDPVDGTVVGSGDSDHGSNSEGVVDGGGLDFNSEIKPLDHFVLPEVGDIVEDVDLVVPVIDMNLSVFESSPYNFSGKYPAQWYYSGTASTTDGVLRHYGFTDDDTEDADELVSVDVISSLPAGRILNYEGVEYVETENDGVYSLSVKVGNRILSVYGDDKYRDLILNMATSLNEVSYDEV